MSTVYFTGLSRVLSKLNREVAKIQRGSTRGITLAALEVKNRSQRLTPVDTGNLRNSAYTNVQSTPMGASGEIGYTASYAPFVHERRARHTVGQWKFLETALRQLKGRIIDLIKKYSEV